MRHTHTHRESEVCHKFACHAWRKSPWPSSKYTVVLLLLLLSFWHLPTLDNYSFSINLRNVVQNKKSTPLEALTRRGNNKVEVREMEREREEGGVRLVSASAKYILYNCTRTYKRVCFGSSRQQQKPKQKSDGQKSWTIKLWLSFASGRPNCFIMNVNLLRYAKQNGCIYPEHVLVCVYLSVCVCACTSRVCVWHFSHEIRMWVRLVGFYLHSFRGEQQESQLNT